MRDLSLHLLDLMENSLRAGAKNICCELTLNEGGTLALTLQDDGCGMEEALCAAALQPFTTSRSTRKAGLGLPLTQASALRTGGSLRLDSAPGHGTRVSARFETRHLDCLPLGSLEDTMVSLIAAHPLTPDFTLVLRSPRGKEQFSTQVVRAALGDDVPLSEPEVLAWMRQALKKQVQTVFGGLLE